MLLPATTPFVKMRLERPAGRDKRQYKNNITFKHAQSEAEGILNGLFFLKSHTKLSCAKIHRERLCRIVRFVNCLFGPPGL